MRKIKEILRPKYEAKLTQRQIGSGLSISPGTVSTYIYRAKLMGIEEWPLPIEWDEIKLTKYFIQTKKQPRTTHLQGFFKGTSTVCPTGRVVKVCSCLFSCATALT
jgi:hypothetical protein